MLEIGCGTGLLTQALRQQLNAAEWIATDLSAGMLESCRSRVEGQGVRLVCMDGERLALRGEFDLICSSLAMQWFVSIRHSLPALTRSHGSCGG